MSGSYTYEWDSGGNGQFSTDISAYVLSCKTQRGRKDDLGRFPPGTATLVLNNEDGRFSPDKAAGPYYGNLKPYRRVRIKGTVVGASTYGMFWAYVVGWELKPRATQQVAVWYLTDLFGIWQEKLASIPLMRKVSVQTALHVALSRILTRNKISNPSLEQTATNWSAIGGASADRDAGMKLEGDKSYRVDCPGDASGEGCRYDATGDFAAGDYWLAVIFARIDEGSTTLRFQGYDDGGDRDYVEVSVGTDWKRLEIAWTITSRFSPVSSNRYFKVVTAGATEVTVWIDVLFVQQITALADWLRRDFDSGTAEIELAARYRESSLGFLQAIAQSEPRSFFFPYTDITHERLRFRDKDWRATAIAAGPVATFSDDGADVPWFDVLLTERATQRISEAEVTSQGDYEDGNEEVTIWELLPTGQEIAAGETLSLHVLYPQPARDCSLILNSPDATPRPFDAEGSGDDDDGYLLKYGDEYPPTDSSEVNVAGSMAQIGQYKVGSMYYVWRTYLAFATAPIPDAANVSAARLRLKLFIDSSKTDFDIEVRLHTWSAGGLTIADWRAGDPPGADTLLGTFNTADLPPNGEWFEIEIDETQINLTANTEIYLHSSRDPGTAPSAMERVIIYTSESGDAPQLIITYDYGAESEVFENYGIGARIAIEAPATAPVIIDALRIDGVPLRGSQEESRVIQASTNPSSLDRTLSIALPLQGTRTASMETEADRLADRYDDDDPPKRISLVLRPKNDTVLTQMLARQIGELIHVENINEAFSTYIDGNFWIQGIEHVLEPGGKLTTTFHLEEQ